MDQVLHVELDCLLDTRLGTVTRYWPERIPALMEAGYRKRQSDDLSLLVPDFPQAEFKVNYAKRDVETLKFSRPTPSVVLLKGITDTLQGQSITSPHVDSITVEVNIYPYTLSEKERDVLVDMVMLYSSLITMVNIVSYTVQQLTPSVLREAYSGLIIYDLEAWLQNHLEPLQRCPCPTVTIMTPVRYNVVPTLEQTAMDARGPTNLFAAMEQFLLEFVGINFHPMECFSLVDIAALRKGDIGE